MKILMINDVGYEYGGVQIYLAELKRSLKRLGHEARVLSSDLNLGRRHLSEYKFKHLDNKKFDERFIGYIHNKFAYQKLKQILKEFKPDVVHLNYIFSQASPSILLLLKNFPTLITLHGSSMICPLDKINSKKEICNSNFGGIKCIKCLKYKYPYQAVRYQIYKKLSKNIDKFIAISNYIKEDFKKNNFTEGKKIIVIHNKIHLLKFSKLINKKNLLYVGRLSKEKGVEYLIKAIPKILKSFSDIKLTIAGRGNEEKNLKKLVKHLNIVNNVIFLGQVSHKEIGKKYRKASIILVPSTCPEAFGLIGPEAMSIGRPVIASNVGGIPEWLDNGKTGFLVPPKDSNAIAEKVIYLLKRPSLMQKMGRVARKKAEKEFDIRDYVKKIEKLYFKVIEDNKNKIYNNGGSDIFK